MSGTGIIDIGKVIREKVEEILNSSLCYEPQLAKVIDYDYKKRCATIQPLLEIQSYNGESIPLQPISEVPVFLPSTKEFTFSMPIKKDDEGIVFFTKLGYNNWYAGGGLQQEDIASRGIHNCFFLPSIFHGKIENDKIDNGKDVIYEFKGVEIRLTEDGEMFVKNGKNELKLKKNGGFYFLANEVDFFKLIEDFVNKVESSFKEVFTQIKNVNNEVKTMATTLSSAQYGTPPGPTTATPQLTAQVVQITTEITQNEANATQISTDIKQIENDARKTQGN